MSGRPRDVTRDDLTADLGAHLSRKEAELIEANCRTTTANERAERAIRWAVALEQQLAEATRLLNESYLLRSAVEHTPERAFRFQYDVDAFLKAAHPVECPACDGQGEIGVSQDYYGNWNIETCRDCGGLG